jgi:glycerol-3-phosphate cytidylyltransferase-like family protein
MKVIEKIKPDIIAVGHDQHDVEKTVKNYIETRGLKIKTAKIGKFSQDELDSSSKIKQKIIKHY